MTQLFYRFVVSVESKVFPDQRDVPDKVEDLLFPFVDIGHGHGEDFSCRVDGADHVLGPGHHFDEIQDVLKGFCVICSGLILPEPPCLKIS